MSNLTLFLFGMTVFGLLLIGLALTMSEFLKVSDRPDLVKGEQPPANKEAA